MMETPIDHDIARVLFFPILGPFKPHGDVFGEGKTHHVGNIFIGRIVRSIEGRNLKQPPHQTL